jgi:hypothetical protein
MQIIKTDMDMPIFKIMTDNHKIIKPLILEYIKSMGSYSLINKNQQVKNTDWHLSAEFKRPYYEHIEPIAENACKHLKEYLNYKNNNLRPLNYWYQQYAKGDYHTWHNHGSASFSCVYYVDLNKDNPKTTFKINKNEFEIKVEEGEVLIFPGFLEHTSKENISDYVKTIISFNLGL